MLFYIILATTLVSAISFIGIFSVYKKFSFNEHSLKLIISLSAGALLAVSFLDLLPEAMESTIEAKNIFLVVLCSILLFFILEKYWHWHHCRCVDCTPDDPRLKKNIIMTNLVGDGIHNLTDGFLIATAFMIDVKVGIITTAVVMIHEIPQEISDFGVLVFAGLTKARALFYNVVFALSAVFGGILFYFFGQRFEYFIPYMIAFAAGTFIYLATADLIPELHHEKNPNQVILHTFWLLAGVAIIFIITIFIPDIH